MSEPTQQPAAAPAVVDTNPNDQYITPEAATAVIDSINALQPPISSWGELCELAIQVTPYVVPDLAKPALYCAVWREEGFSQVCKLVADDQAGYGADPAAGNNWDDRMRNEWKAWHDNHQPAAQYGLPSGFVWFYVKTKDFSQPA